MQCNIPQRPGELVCLDYYGPLPRAKLDAFSKYVALYPLKRATTIATIRKFLNEYVPTLGKPMGALTDRGSQFTAKLWSRELTVAGIKPRFCSPRHPASNPAERVMRELGRVFKSFCSEKHSTWLGMIPHLMQWLNVTVHESTGVTPYELQFGRKPVSEISRLIDWPESHRQEPSAETIIVRARNRLEKRAAARKAAAEGVGKNHIFKVNDLVLVRAHHLSSAVNKEMSKFFH
ncbi:hypothetical protein B566_EDAN012787, partial [Ephemera danica]